MDYEKIGMRVCFFRRRMGLSQEQLAELVDISVPHMSHIETGNTKLSLPVFVALADALGVRTDELLHDPAPPIRPAVSRISPKPQRQPWTDICNKRGIRKMGSCADSS